MRTLPLAKNEGVSSKSLQAFDSRFLPSFGETLEEAVDAGINWIHMDVMDGNWVVNKTITFGPALIRSIRDRVGPNIFIDCHLMITNAEQTWMQYVDAGVDLVIAHIEAIDNSGCTNLLYTSGCQVGLVLNPDTPANSILPYLTDLDLVLVMSVVPERRPILHARSRRQGKRIVQPSIDR